MRAELLGSIADVDRGEWNRLALHDSVYQSHQWLTTLEGDGGSRSWYATVRDTAGKLVGALPVHHCPGETADAYRADRLFSGAPGPWHEPGVTVGGRRGYHNAVALDPALQPGERQEVIGALLDAVHEVRRSVGASAAYFFYAPASAVEELRPACPDVVPVLTDMEATLTLPGKEFGDYLGLFPSRKAGVHREQRVFEAAGYDVTLERLADTWQEIAPIRAQVDRRHGREWTDAEMAELLRRYAEGMDDISLVYCCRVGGDLVACSVFHLWGETLYLRMVGFDYGRLRDAYEYFNLMFYLPIAYAYAHGGRRLHYGIGSHRAKVLRKATLTPLWTVKLAGTGGDPAAAGAWNDARMARWRAGFADCAWAFGDPVPR